MENTERKPKIFSKNLILLAVTIICLILCTIAWFSNGNDARAGGIQMTVETPVNIQVAINSDKDEDYGNNIDLNSTTALNGLVFRDITSDGKTFLYPNESSQDYKGSHPTIGKGFKEVNSTYDYLSDDSLVPNYISFVMNIRTQTPMKVYLADVSNVIAKAEADNLPLIGENSDNKSTYGDFSKDCIIGATRMSVVNSEDQVEFLWIPRPDIFLSTASTGTLSLAQNVDLGASYIHSYIDSSEVQSAFYSSLYKSMLPGDVTTVAQLAQASQSNLGDCNTTADDTELSEYQGNLCYKNVGLSSLDSINKESFVAQTTKQNEDDFYYTASVRINFWVEGTDNEARRALSGGRFNVKLSLVSEEVEETTQEASAQ